MRYVLEFEIETSDEDEQESLDDLTNEITYSKFIDDFEIFYFGSELPIRRIINIEKK